MEFSWFNERILIDDELVRGVCRICGLPVLIDIPIELLTTAEDADLLIDLTFDMGDNLHELCMDEPDYFSRVNLNSHQHK